ncbi:MAG: hypothetical protein ACR2QC_00440 [Gammaproteobacteria bacterium]
MKTSFAVFLASMAIGVPCFILVDAENYPVVNILLSVFALCAAAVAAASFFHHLSSHSIAQKAFHVFTIFVVCRVAVFFTAYYYGNRTDFLALAETILATGTLVVRGGHGIPALGLNIALVMIITGGCYLCEDEVRWPVSIMCLWALVLGIFFIGIVVAPI